MDTSALRKQWESAGEGQVFQFVDSLDAKGKQTLHDQLGRFDPKELKKFIDQKNNELSQKLKMVSKTRVPMMGLVRTLSEAFPSDIRVDVNTLSLNDQNMKVEGVIYEGDLNKVLEAMKKVPQFDKVTLEKDGQRFTFKGEVVGRR